MARTIHRIPTTTDQATLNVWITDFMRKKSYKQKMRNNQYIWKKGGFWTAARFIQVGFGPDFVQVEAFVKYFGENAADDGSFFASVPKQLLLSDMNELEQFIYMNGNLQQQPQVQPQQPQAQPQQPQAQPQQPQAQPQQPQVQPQPQQPQVQPQPQQPQVQPQPQQPQVPPANNN